MNDLTESFAAKVAAALGAPEAAARVYEIMGRWTPFEWNAAYTGPRGKFNPLAITTKTGTSTPLGGNPNQNGGNPVQNYGSEDEGAKLTAQFLMNGRYPDVVNWMKTGTLDRGKVASQIRTWGTTGFANEVGGGKVTTAATSSAPAGDTGGSEFQAFLTENGVGPVKTAADFETADTVGADGKKIAGVDHATAELLASQANAQRATQIRELSGAYGSYRTAIGKGVLSPDQQRQQDITNKINELDAAVRAGTLDASVAATKLTAFVNEQKSALDLGQQQLTAHAEMDKYGPGGDFSYNDLGGAFQQYAKDNKIDPTSSGLKFTTPTPFDPVAAYKSNAELMGAGAGPPGGPQAGDITQQIQDLLGGGQSTPGNDGGGVPSWGTGPGGPYITPTDASNATDNPYPNGVDFYSNTGAGQDVVGQAAIRPTGVDQNGRAVTAAPSQYSQKAMGHIVPSIAARGGGG